MSKHYFGFIVAMLGMFALAGCQSASSPSAAGPAMSPPQRAVVISGNGGSTVVYVPTSDPNAPMMLSSEGSATEVCPDCKAAAIKYFQTGVLEPHCPRCGATRRVVTIVNTDLGHQ